MGQDAKTCIVMSSWNTEKEWNADLFDLICKTAAFKFCLQYQGFSGGCKTVWQRNFQKFCESAHVGMEITVLLLNVFSWLEFSKFWPNKN